MKNKVEVEAVAVESVEAASVEPSLASVAKSKPSEEATIEAKFYTDKELSAIKAGAYESGKKSIRLRVPALSQSVDAVELSKTLLDLKSALGRIVVPDRLARLRIQFDGGILQDFPPQLLSALRKENIISKELETRARAATKLAESLIALGYR